MARLPAKGLLRLRLMFDGAWKTLTLAGVGFGLAALVGTVILCFLVADLAFAEKLNPG